MIAFVDGEESIDPFPWSHHTAMSGSQRLLLWLRKHKIHPKRIINLDLWGGSNTGTFSIPSQTNDLE